MSPPSQTVPAFTSHNILLDNGRYARSADLPLLEQGGWFVSAKQALDMIFPGERESIEICDSGCLEGWYATFGDLLTLKVTGNLIGVMALNVGIP